MKSIFQSLIILIALFIDPLIVFGQCTDTVSLAVDSLQFNVAGGTIHAIEKYNDTLYLGGSFTYVGRYTGCLFGINKSNSQIYNYASWPRTNGTVYQAIPDGSGGMIITGDFTRVGDSLRNNVAQISAAGLVTSFKADADNIVWSALLYNGELFLGGDFLTINSVARTRIASVTLSTDAVTAWNPNANSTVYTLATDGSLIYAGGVFTSMSSTGRSYLAAIAISTGALSSWNPGTNGNVRCMLINNNKLYIGGSFTTAASASRSYIAAIDKTTAVATSWNPNASADVMTMAFGPGRIYAGGNFASIGGQPRTRLAALDTVAGNALSLNVNIAGGNVYSLFLSGTSIYVGGSFGTVASQSRPHFCILDTATSNLSSLDAGIYYATATGVYAIYETGSTIFMGGSIVTAGGVTRSCLAAIDLKNNTILPWSPTVSGASAAIYALKADSGKVYIGGKFSTINGSSRIYVASFDMSSGYSLTSWNPFNISGTFNYVYSLALSGSYAYIGGHFNFVNNGTHIDAARLDKTTGVIDSWAPSFPNNPFWVDDIIVTNTNVYIGGEFYDNTSSQGYFTRYDFSNSSSNLYNLNEEVKSIKLYDGKYFLGGLFTLAGSAQRWRATGYRINPSAGLTWNPTANNTVNCVEASNGRVYLGGDFTTMGTASRRALATVDTVNGTVFNAWRPAFKNTSSLGSVEKILALGDTIFVAGGFSDVSGRKIVGLARFHLSYPTPTVTITPSINPICAGTSSVTFTATTNVSGGTYQWKKNGSNVGSNSTNYSYTPINGDQLTCTVTIPSNTCFLATAATSSIYTVNVLANTTPTITVNAGANNICSGTSVSFSTTTNVTGGSYQWQVNSTNVGSNSSSYSYTPANNDIVSCTVTKSTGSCYSPSSATDDTTMVVIPNVTPTVTVNPAANNVCTGTSVSFTATTNVSSGNYQWKVNGTNSGTNSSTYSYTPANNDIVSCTVTKTSGCYTQSSVTDDTTMTVLVYTTPTASAGANPSGNVCTGTTVTYTTTTNITNGSYQWKVNSSNAGSNSSTYAYMPANSDQVQCVVTATSGCYSPVSVTTSTLTASVTANTTSTVAVSATANNVCAGTSVGFTATTNVSGGSYQWKIGTTSVGTNSSSYTYTPANGDVVSCTVTKAAGSCYLPASVTDDTAMIVIANTTPSISILATANPICQGVADTFTATTNVTSGTYQWQVNGSNAGTNNASYSFVPANNDIVRCIINVPTGCFSKPADTSGNITVVVILKTKPNITISGPAMITKGSPVNLTAMVNNAGSNFSIAWKNNSGVFTTTSVPNTSYLKGIGTDTISALITPPGCYDTTTSNTILVQEDLSVRNHMLNDAVLVYPNPFVNQLKFKGLKQGDAINIYDVLGRKIFSFRIENWSAEYSITTDKFGKGYYLIEIADNCNNIKGAAKVEKL